jgi:PAS domain S-box-containing protein
MIALAPWALAGLKAADSVPPQPVSYATHTYDIGTGLPFNSAWPVIQTRDGYIWIATTAGLTRFDGARFVTYRVSDTPGLADNQIRALLEDDTGALWVGTQRGLSRYWQGRMELIGLSGIAITSILKDRTGRLWVATLEHGLWEYRDGKFAERKDPVIPVEQPLHDVRSLFMDSTGRVWVWLRSRGMAFFEGDTLKLFNGFGAASDQGVPMAETPSGTLWFGTEQGVFRLRDGQMRKYGVEQGLGNAAIRHLYADSNGGIWASANKLYLLERPDAESFVTVPVGVEYARWVMQDREGSIWVGTPTEGLWQVRSSAFRMVRPRDPLLDGNVRALAVDRAGATWASLPNGGAVRMMPNGQTSVVETDGVVSTICPAADGSVWLGTPASLRVWRDGNQRVYPQFKRVYAIYQDRAGAIWIGAEEGGGVVRYENGNFDSSYGAQIRKVLPNKPPTVLARTFSEDAEGALYIGLVFRNSGVVKLKDGVITQYYSKQIFETSEVFSVYPDSGGNLWIGTRGKGLVLFSQGRWSNPDSFSIPFNDQVVTITEDNSGHLWIGTFKGILWAPKADLLAMARGERSSVVFRQAAASDGIRPAAVGSGIYGAFPAAWKAGDTIFFATQRGVAAVDTRMVSAISTVAPLIKIERVLRNDQALDTGTGVRLQAGTRTLTIDYTALSFVQPDRVLFRYRLEGHDTNWVEAGTRRTAYYTNLGPGTYTFRVTACNSDGVWNEAGASLAIAQEPFFYETVWFWCAAAIVLGLGVIAAFRLWTAALRRRNEELERRIAERTAELAKSNETIRASEYLYHSLVESLPQIIARRDAEGRYTYVNTAFAEMVGRPVDRIIGQSDREILPPDQVAKNREDDLRAMQTGEVLEYENVIERAGHKKRYLHVKKVPLFRDHLPIGVLVLFWDMTVFRETEEQLREAQRELIETSRLAGIAEVATGVLHNLGNALNSVNTSASLAAERLRKSKVPSVSKVAQLLMEQGDRLVEFFAADPRGRQLPAYLEQLASLLQAERAESVRELEALQDGVDHIKQIVPAAELIEYSLRISDASLNRHGVSVSREFSPAPPVKVERQKVLQIIVNLIRNAKESMNEARETGKLLTIGVRVSAEGRVQIYVTDNGVGIAPENITRVFGFGYTTKVAGHGYGLHSSANAAKEMGGSLHAQSDGTGKGATFILELPTAG